MNTDIRISTIFWAHPKTKKLERRCGGANGSRALLMLWCWAAMNRPNGDLTGMDAEAVEIAAGWDGAPGELFKCLCEIGWIDSADGRYMIHDWGQHNPWVQGSILRADAARFSRLKQVNYAAWSDLSRGGRTSITREEYDVLINKMHDSAFSGENRGDFTKHHVSNENDSLFEEKRGSPGKPPASVGGSPAPAPVPVPKNNNQGKDKKAPMGPDTQSDLEAVRKVFEHWKATVKPVKASLTPPRIQTIREAFNRGHTAEECCQAITAMSKDDFAMGERYNELRHALAVINKVDKVEWWINRAGRPGPRRDDGKPAPQSDGLAGFPLLPRMPRGES